MAAMLESMFLVRAGYTDPAIIEQDSMVLFRRKLCNQISPEFSGALQSY